MRNGETFIIRNTTDFTLIWSPSRQQLSSALSLTWGCCARAAHCMQCHHPPGVTSLPALLSRAVKKEKY